MWSSGVVRQVALIVGAAAVLGSGALTACSSKEKPAETKPSSSTSAPSLAPTEKANVGSFAPTVTARPAPTALPGNVRTGQ